LENQLRNIAQPIPACRQADTQILLYRQLREDLAPLRHIANAERGPALRRDSLQRLTVEHQLARSQRQQSHDAFEQRGLAHAVATHETSASASRYRQVDVPQNVTSAVELIELSQFE